MCECAIVRCGIMQRRARITARALAPSRIAEPSIRARHGLYKRQRRGVNRGVVVG